MKKQKKTKRWLIVVGAILVLIVSGFLGLRNMAQSAAANNSTTYTISRGDISIVSIATGKIESADEDTLKLSGTVSKMFVEVGDVVSKGDVLGEYTKTSTTAQELYAPTSGIVTKVASTLDNTFEISGGTTLSMDMPVSEYQINKIALGTYAEVYVQATDETFYGEVKSKSSNVNALGQYIISLEFTNTSSSVLVGMNAVAKIDIPDTGVTYYHGDINYGNAREVEVNGTMLSLNVAVGDRVKSGQSLGSYQARAVDAKIIASRDGVVSSLPSSLSGDVVISNPDALQLVVNIAETDIHKLSFDQVVSIYVEAVDQSFEGKIVKISQIGNTATDYTTYPVTLQFDGKDAPIFLGMSGSAKIVVESKSNLLIVPYEALISEGTERYLISADWLNSPSRPQSDFYIPVTTGFADVYQIEVLGDDLEGQEIVIPQSTTNLQGLFNRP